MTAKFNERLIAYLALFSGLSLSVVAEYYSIVGLTAIFPTAVVPVVIMGIVLGLGKIVGTVWLKQNWSIAPFTVKAYLITAILTLMFITSMGIFGFLSRAHLEQTVPTGDVVAKIALIDEQIRVEKENIDEYRKSLAQLDSQVDQRLSRSTDGRGAERSVQIRRQQQSERSQLQKSIASAQNNIARLNSEKAPLAADLRKVEAEVGPIKYIAQFVYGNADAALLEKAVTWVIIILIVVFDPLALILLLASQISFQNLRKIAQNNDPVPDPEPQVVPREEAIATPPVETSAKEDGSILDKHPYLLKKFSHFPNLTPLVYLPSKEEAEWEQWKETGDIPADEVTTVTTGSIESIRLKDDVKRFGYSAQGDLVKVAGRVYNKDDFEKIMGSSYVQNEEQSQGGLWQKISQAEYEKTAVQKNTTK